MNVERMKGKRLGEVLTSMGIITTNQLREVLSVQKKTSLPLGKILVSLGYTDEEVILSLLGKFLNAPFIRLSEVDEIDYSLVNTLPKDMLIEELVFPVRKEENLLIVAMADPRNIELIQKLESMFGMKIKAYIASESEIKNMVERMHIGRA